MSGRVLPNPAFCTPSSPIHAPVMVGVFIGGCSLSLMLRRRSRTGCGWTFLNGRDHQYGAMPQRNPLLPFNPFPVDSDA